MTKRNAQIVAITIVALATVVFARTLVYATLIGPTDPAANGIQAAEAAPISENGRAPIPVRLTVPAAAIDAKLQRVGLTESGALGVPSNFTDAAWYAKGVRPGNIGTAYIDGHVDNGLGLAGVFKHLSSVKVGDAVFIEGAHGTTTRFTVTNVASYPYDSPETKAIFERHADGAYVELITCGGSWVPSARTYDHRLVVTAKMDAP